MTNIFKWTTILLAILLIAGFIYLKRENSILLESNQQLSEVKIKTDEVKVEELNKDGEVFAKELESLKNENKTLTSQNSKLRTKLSEYEKIRYYDDLDFDKSSVIISNSRYRHQKQNDSIR